MIIRKNGEKELTSEEMSDLYLQQEWEKFCMFNTKPCSFDEYKKMKEEWRKR